MVAAASVEIPSAPVPESIVNAPFVDVTLRAPDPDCTVVALVLLALPRTVVFTAAPVAILTVVAEASVEMLVAFVPELMFVAPPDVVIPASPVRRPVTVKAPGAVEGLDRLTVTVDVLASPVVFNWPLAPATNIFPAVGGTTVESSVVRVSRTEEPAASTVHTALEAVLEVSWYTSPKLETIPMVPKGNLFWVDVGAEEKNSTCTNVPTEVKGTGVPENACAVKLGLAPDIYPHQGVKIYFYITTCARSCQKNI